MKCVRQAYRDESKSENKPFTQDGAWSVLKEHYKWDSPEVDPVDLTGHAELFSDVPRAHSLGKQKRPSRKTKLERSLNIVGSNVCEMSCDLNENPLKRRMRWRGRKTKS